MILFLGKGRYLYDSILNHNIVAFMKIGLFIPCYINQYYPSVGIATYNLLRKLEFEVEFPTDQTCCGQALGNAGYERYTNKAKRHFHNIFDQYEIVVAPSASCVLYAKEHSEFNKNPKQKIMELSEFLVSHAKLDQLTATYAKKVGVLQGCHGLRGLQLGNPSELMISRKSMIHEILRQVKDIKLIEVNRPDDCCGFGGTFSLKEPDLSVKMGQDRIDEFIASGVEVVTGTDVSCLMHLEGIINRRKLQLETKHFSEILMPS